MSNQNSAEYRELFRNANSPETLIVDLKRICNLKDELLSAAVALNPSANREILINLEKDKSESVVGNIKKRYQTHPSLYTMKMREVVEDDAEYVFSLRTNSEYNRYISQVGSEVDKQKDYINSYASNNDAFRSSFYFIIERLDNKTRCGTVRIYNFTEDCFEWGSWILDENKTRYSAMETAIFVYDFAFNNLGFSKCEFEVDKLNEKVVSFHLKSGAIIIYEDDKNYYFRITKNEGLEFASNLRQRLDVKSIN